MTHFMNAAEREAAIRALDPKKHRAVLAYRRDQGPETAAEYPLRKEPNNSLRVGLDDLIRYGNGDLDSYWVGEVSVNVLLAVIPHPLPPLPTAFGSVIEAEVVKREIKWSHLRMVLADDPSNGDNIWAAENGEWYSDSELSDWTIHFDAATIEENQ